MIPDFFHANKVFKQIYVQLPNRMLPLFSHTDVIWLSLGDRVLYQVMNKDAKWVGRS